MCWNTPSFRPSKVSSHFKVRDATSSQCWDLCVIGAGSGGIGAALAAARMGLRVILVEKGGALGGNAVRGGVSNWEPGVGGTSYPFEIYRRLRQLPEAAWIGTTGRHCSTTPPGSRQFPGGEVIPDPSASYAQTLFRSCNPPLPREVFFSPETPFRRVVLEPAAYSQVVETMLHEAGVSFRLGAAAGGVDVTHSALQSITLEDGAVIAARFFIDATAEAVVCGMAGCERLSGREARSVFDEPDAPEEASDEMNGVTLIYRVKPAARKTSASPVVPCWWADRYPMAVFTQMPAGGWMVNMLPTMEGAEFLSLGRAAAQTECEKRVRAHWTWAREQVDAFAGMEIDLISPALGVREGPRIRARTMLTQHDLLLGVSGQAHEDIIALADHAMDRHGKGGGCRELLQPYGVPYGCLLPVGLDNVAVASRAAGFSSIAASSCRLSRTMMDLGHAAGAAVALAQREARTLPDVSPTELKNTLRSQMAWIDWPLPDALRQHLSKT